MEGRKGSVAWRSVFARMGVGLGCLPEELWDLLGEGGSGRDAPLEERG